MQPPTARYNAAASYQQLASAIGDASNKPWPILSARTSSTIGESQPLLLYCACALVTCPQARALFVSRLCSCHLCASTRLFHFSLSRVLSKYSCMGKILSFGGDATEGGTGAGLSNTNRSLLMWILVICGEWLELKH